MRIEGTAWSNEQGAVLWSLDRGPHQHGRHLILERRRQYGCIGAIIWIKYFELLHYDVA